MHLSSPHRNSFVVNSCFSQPFSDSRDLTVCAGLDLARDLSSTDVKKLDWNRNKCDEITRHSDNPWVTIHLYST